MNLFLFILSFILLGCAQNLKTPINRLISPEAIGRGIQVESHEIGLVYTQFDYEGERVDNPVELDVTKGKELFLGLGVSESADIFLRIPSQSSSMIGIKVQVLGMPMKSSTEGHSVSFSLAMGNEQDALEEPYKISFETNVSDFSIIHGYRFNNLFMIYDGVSSSNYQFSGSIDEGDEKDFTLVANNAVGMHLGMMIGTHNLSLKLELGAQQVRWSYTDTQILYSLGSSLMAGW